jgi:hypothetical protein
VNLDTRESMGQDGPLLQLSGTLLLFGFPPAEASLKVVPRSLAWRGALASAYVGGGLLLAPVLGMVPPHAPWAAGVLVCGGFLGVRKWRERFTLVCLDGICPKCAGGVSIPSHVPLKSGISVPCEGCHHDSRLLVTMPLPSNSSGEGGIA